VPAAPDSNSRVPEAARPAPVALAAAEVVTSNRCGSHRTTHTRHTSGIRCPDPPDRRQGTRRSGGCQLTVSPSPSRVPGR
jgi:hypothetical protein